MLSDVVLHKACRPVTTQPFTAHFMGATVGSNNTGELTAWMESALYLLGNPDLIQSSITFLYDSKWAANMVTGKFRAKRNRSLVANAKRKDLCTGTVQNPSALAVGQRAQRRKHNEHADELAEKGKQTQDYLGGRKEAEFYTPATLPSEITPPVEVQGATIDATSSTFTQALVSAEEVTFKTQRNAPRTPWITSRNLRRNFNWQKTNWQSTTPRERATE